MFQHFPNKLFISIFLLSLFLANICTAQENDFILSSSNFKNGEILPLAQVFNDFGCNGENKAPELSWTKPPRSTKSLAITMYDPDAPTGSGWWHWLIINLPIDLKSIPADSGNSSKANELGLDTIYTRTDYGKAGYGGACPPTGNKAHRYIFTVWALNIDKRPLNADASGAMVGYYLNQHVIKKASMTAYSERKK